MEKGDNKMDKIKFGVIGCGTVAGYGHIPAIASLKEAELFALADIDEERLKEVGAKYNVKHLFTEYRDLLKLQEIEAVTVATPLESHYPIVMEAAKYRKHVLCEKPISNDLREGQEMVEAMQKANRLLAINFELRLSDVAQEAKKELEKGSIGKPGIMRFIYLWSGPSWAGEERLDMLMEEGLGPIVDCGVHSFDLARWLGKSEFKEIQADGVYLQGYPNPDHVVASCKLENGIMVVIEQSWVYTHKSEEKRSDRRYDIIGDEGVITYITDHENINDFLVYTKNKTIKKEYKESKHFERLYGKFVESIKKGRLEEDIASGEDGLKATEAALLALQSAKCSQKIKLS